MRSAAPLSPEKVQSLEQSLARLTGKQVQLDVTIDPSLIGGVVARIGSTVYDGSIRTQLEKMKQQLVEGPNAVGIRNQEIRHEDTKSTKNTKKNSETAEQRGPTVGQ